MVGQAERVPQLTKRDVEQLLAAPPPTLTAEVAGLRRALGRALATVLGAEIATPWPELVARAARVGGWDDDLVATLLDTGPEGAAHLRDVLWDLAAVLNEERALRSP